MTATTPHDAAAFLHWLESRGACVSLIGAEHFVRIALDAIPDMTAAEAQQIANAMGQCADELRAILLRRLH